MSAGLGIVLQPDTFYSAALVASSMLYTGSDWCCGTEIDRACKTSKGTKS